MTSRDIPRHRLINQQIALARSKEPAELMTSLGAMQAQDYLGTLWAIGLRLPDATEHSVERAIADRTIVRSWPLRGTLHFVVGTWKRIIKRESVVVMPAPFGSLTQVESRAMSAAIERYRKFLGLRLETERRRAQMMASPSCEVAGRLIPGRFAISKSERESHGCET